MLVLFIALFVAGAVADDLAAEVASSRDCMNNVLAYVPQLVADEDNACGFTAVHQEIFTTTINPYLECLNSVETREAFDACQSANMDAEMIAAEAAGLDAVEVAKIIGCAIDSAPKPEA